MSDNFEVASSSSGGELPEEKRHEVVAAQLRGEAKAAGQGPEAVVAAVSAELESLGLEPNPTELHRRYEEIDPELPELADADEDAAGGAADEPADAEPRSGPDAIDGPVSAGLEGGRDRGPVDDPEGDEPARP